MPGHRVFWEEPAPQYGMDTEEWKQLYRRDCRHEVPGLLVHIDQESFCSVGGNGLETMRPLSPGSNRGLW